MFSLLCIFAYSNKTSQEEAKELKDKVRKSGCAKLIDNYSNSVEGAEKAYQELERVVRLVSREWI